MDILDAAVEAGVSAALERNYGGLAADETTQALMRDDIRAALEAALPYLAHAEPWYVARQRHSWEEPNPGQWLCKDCGAEEDDEGNQTAPPLTSCCSAAPAVPQPADARLREHLDSCVWIDPGRQSGQPCFGGTRIPVAPFMAIVDEAGEDAAKAFWPSVTDAHIAAGRAWQAAVPQPVDREALGEALNICDTYERMGMGSASAFDKGGQRAAHDIGMALRKLLAGEQEQVESP